MARRAGLPEDVAALVSKIEPRRVVVTLVNVNPLKFRIVTVQSGAYGEHQLTSVQAGAAPTMRVAGNTFEVRLAPGAGETLTIGLQRYANQPSLAFPWDR